MTKTAHETVKEALEELSWTNQDLEPEHYNRIVNTIDALLDTHVLVPREPTEEMHLAGRNANVGPKSTRHAYIYKSMLASYESGGEGE